MEKTSRKLLAGFLAVVIVLTLAPPIIATETNFEGSPSQIIEGRLILDEEIVYVEGIPVLFQRSIDNGVIIDTASIMETTSRGEMQIMAHDSGANNALPDDFVFDIMAAIEVWGGIEEKNQEEDAPPYRIVASSINESGFRRQQGQSNRNPNVWAEHSFNWHGHMGGFFPSSQLTLWNGEVRGFYLGQGNAYSMRLSQTITFSSFGISSWSWPWPSVSWSHGTAFNWTSGNHNNIALFIVHGWSNDVIITAGGLTTPATMVAVTTDVDVGTRINGSLRIDGASTQTRLGITGPTHN